MVTALAEFKLSGPVPSVDSCSVNKRGPLVLLLTHTCVEFNTMREKERERIDKYINPDYT